MNKISTPVEESFFQRDNTMIYYHGLYKGKLREFILSYKFRNHHSLAREFSQMLYETIRNQSIYFDIITYVPATKSAKHKRGYDHMRLIAKQLSKLTNKPYINLLLAVRETDQLKTENRQEAVKGKFKINEQKLKNLIKEKSEHLNTREKIEKKKILLIDDVYTTGSTIKECINTLKISGLENIIVLVIAMNN
ncbi:MAG: ComF family protein [Fervidobacterium sp.]